MFPDGMGPDGVWPQTNLVVGWGCLNLAIQIVPQFGDRNREERIEWGWADGMGQHISYFCPHKGIYVRQSMSGRTDYRLRVTPLTQHSNPWAGGWQVEEVMEVTFRPPCDACAAGTPPRKE